MKDRQLKLLLATLAILAFSSVLLAACSRSGVEAKSSSSSSGSSGSGSSSNTVHMTLTNFAQSSITITKGSKLTLTNDASVLHIIQNGSWNGSTPRPAKETGVPTINQNFSSSGESHDLGPFTTAGTFHLYCTIHTGMNLTVTVK